jgi:hypothetical protein
VRHADPQRSTGTAELLAWRDIHAELETATVALASATRILRAVGLKGA